MMTMQTEAHSRQLTHIRSGQVRAVSAVLAIAVATIGGAWVFEAYGYLPCELCLKQRIAYYVAIPLSACLIILSQLDTSSPNRLVRVGLFALAAIFLANAGLGTYHAGVEWGFWPGPTECTGTLSSAQTVNDFLKQLDHVKVVRCDEVALRIIGLSLAGWNVIISFLLCVLSFLAAKTDI